MSNTPGSFGYTVTKMDKIADMPFNPHVNIVVAAYTKDGDAVPQLTANLMSEREIDTWVESLKKDLDAAGRGAKAALRSAQQEAKAYRSGGADVGG